MLRLSALPSSETSYARRRKKRVGKKQHQQDQLEQQQRRKQQLQQQQQQQQQEQEQQQQREGASATAGSELLGMLSSSTPSLLQSPVHPSGATLDHRELERQQVSSTIANTNTTHSREILGSTGAPANPKSLLIFHSLKPGLGGEGVLKSVRTVVPARTVTGFRAATDAEAVAAGVSGVVGQAGVGGGGTFRGATGVIVVEFTSEPSAR